MISATITTSIQPSLRATIPSVGERPEGVDNYLRPDGLSLYRQPDAISLYKRPLVPVNLSTILFNGQSLVFNGTNLTYNG